MKVSCPTCKSQAEYSQANPNRPFCSERCKLIDLGEWASEGHRIEGRDAKEALFSEELQGLIDNY